uniref:Uncharacterized protein n=1 Tax=Zooxanthella nutricula TaxID=1333877 RepID=A0A7S2VRH3_9DINO
MMEEDAPRRQPVAPKPPPTTMRDWVQVGDSGYPAGTLWSDVPGSQRAGFLAECGLPPSGDADPDAMPPWHTSGEPVRHDGLVVNSVILFQNTLSSSQGEGEEEGYGDEF